MVADNAWQIVKQVGKIDNKVDEGFNHMLNHKRMINAISECKEA